MVDIGCGEFKTRIDNAGFDGIKVIQREGLGYGVDAILLAGFAAGNTGARRIKNDAAIAELGSGNGIVSFVLLHKLGGRARITGYEMRASAVERAEEACKMNEIYDRVHFIKRDVSDIMVQEKADSYDAVISNPPYFRRASAVPCSDPDKYAARHETTADLKDFITAAAWLLVNGGDFYMVHRPDRLVDILSEMRLAGIEPKELQLVLPRLGEAANILLIHGVKGAGPELKMLPDIFIHGNNSEYSETVDFIYERRTQ